MARITVEDCIDKFTSRFELVLVASQRARKLHSGDEPTVKKDNDKNTVIALREIADSSITVEDMKESLIQEFQTVTINDEEEENLEIESVESDDLKDQNTLNSVDSIKKDEVDEEISELIAAEESEIDEKYIISESSDEVTVDDNPEQKDDNPEQKLDSENL
tara:strand:+ start:257 stop:742 length:486 start_codon:yes stop_codon:yes gene_type:complete